MNTQHRQAGFTIVEMLTVVAIIGILAGLIIVNLSGARRVARDRKRIATVQLISGALQGYIKDGNPLPSPSSYGEAGGGACGSIFVADGLNWDCSFADRNNNGVFFLDFLQPPQCTQPTCPYVDLDPRDPLHPSDSRYYLYTTDGEIFGPSPVFGCQRPFYVLIAGGLETDSGKNDQSCWNGPGAGLDTAFVIVGR